MSRLLNLRYVPASTIWQNISPCTIATFYKRNPAQVPTGKYSISQVLTSEMAHNGMLQLEMVYVKRCPSMLTIFGNRATFTFLSYVFCLDKLYVSNCDCSAHTYMLFGFPHLENAT